MSGDQGYRGNNNYHGEDNTGPTAAGGKRGNRERQYQGQYPQRGSFAGHRRGHGQGQGHGNPEHGNNWRAVPKPVILPSLKSTTCGSGGSSPQLEDVNVGHLESNNRVNSWEQTDRPAPLASETSPHLENAQLRAMSLQMAARPTLPENRKITSAKLWADEDDEIDYTKDPFAEYPPIRTKTPHGDPSRKGSPELLAFTSPGQGSAETGGATIEGQFPSVPQTDDRTERRAYLEAGAQNLTKPINSETVAGNSSKKLQACGSFVNPNTPGGNYDLSDETHGIMRKKKEKETSEKFFRGPAAIIEGGAEVAGDDASANPSANVPIATGRVVAAEGKEERKHYLDDAMEKYFGREAVSSSPQRHRRHETRPLTAYSSTRTGGYGNCNGNGGSNATTKPISLVNSEFDPPPIFSNTAMASEPERRPSMAATPSANEGYKQEDGNSYASNHPRGSSDYSATGYSRDNKSYGSSAHQSRFPRSSTYSPTDLNPNSRHISQPTKRPVITTSQVLKFKIRKGDPEQEVTVKMSKAIEDFSHLLLEPSFSPA